MPEPMSGGIGAARATRAGRRMSEQARMQQSKVLKRWLACGLFCAGGAWAQAAAPTLVYPDELLPTRMVLCQREVGAAERDRRSRLRTCLARRLEGERLIERQCRRQASGVSGAAARSQAQRDCERQALAVPFAELPRRPPPQRPSPAATDTTADSAARVQQPAAGEQ